MVHARRNGCGGARLVPRLQGLAIGRDFLPEDDRPGAAAVVLLGHGIWKNRYAGDAAILGRTIRVNDVPSVVIGVKTPGNF